MSINSIVLAFIAVFLLTYCSNNKRTISDNNNSLGKKKEELLKELVEHYSNPEDSLKVKATKFLIENMAGHGTVSNTWINSEGEEIRINPNKYNCIEKLRQAMDSMGYYQVVKKKQEDLNTIPAKYLIDNINQAFDCWQTNPLGRSASFEQFCELILPYRVGVEKLEDWRTPIMHRYGSLLDSLLKGNDTLTVSQIIENIVSRYDYKFDVKAHALNHHQSYSEMMEYKIGTCEDLEQLNVITCRALGIPAAMDFIPMWGSKNGSHARTMCMDANGTTKVLTDYLMYVQPAKVFRRVFSHHNELFELLDYRKEDIPPFLRDKRYVDATSDHCKCIDIKMKLDFIPSYEKCLYIFIFNYGKWHPIYWAPVLGNDSIEFKNMGTDVVYRIGTYHNGVSEFLTEPFIPDVKGNTYFFQEPNAFDDTLIVQYDWGLPYLGDLWIEENKTYQLYYWNRGWQYLSESKAHKDPHTFRWADGWTFSTESDLRNLDKEEELQNRNRKKVNKLFLVFENVPENALFRICSPDDDMKPRFFIRDKDYVKWY